MRIRSAITDRVYNPDSMVYLENPIQIAKYIKHGATLYDLLENNDVLVGVFSKKETSYLYKLWQEHKLD